MLMITQRLRTVVLSAAARAEARTCFNVGYSVLLRVLHLSSMVATIITLVDFVLACSRLTCKSAVSNVR
jgi:hypothetical protein